MERVKKRVLKLLAAGTTFAVITILGILFKDTMTENALFVWSFIVAFVTMILLRFFTELLFLTPKEKEIETFLKDTKEDETAPNSNIAHQGNSIQIRETLDNNQKYIRSTVKNKYRVKKELENNYDQLRKYYSISVSQAKTAFSWAVFLSIIGILLIAFAVASPNILDIPVEYSLLPTVGVIAGAVVEIFAGTILAVYIKTLSQISIYHTALVDHQRYLSCANLAELMSTTQKRDAMFRAIIREEIKKSSILQTESSKAKAKVARKKKTR